MDVVYVFKHSPHADIELRYSLRSVDKHMPWAGKVWIFGDRPNFLVNDTSLVEHVPHEYIAPVFGFQTPITNFFRLLFASSQLPEVSSAYLHFADDYILLDDLSHEKATKTRYLEDLTKVKNRGRGLWKESLWRTHDLLRRLGYPSLSYETHTPQMLRKRWVLEAYRDFQDFTTSDWWYGMLGLTAILNHAVSKNHLPVVHVGTEATRVGFWGRQPAFEEVAETARGKLFLNYDDRAWCSGIAAFLHLRFPKPSRYEMPDAGINETAASRVGFQITTASVP